MRNGQVVDAARVRAIFGDSFRSDNFVLRTRYETTVENIEAVFPIEDVYYGIYENMFELNNINRLSGFLGIDARYEHARIVKNASPNDAKMDNDLINQCREFYDETYDFCHRRFPETKRLWRN